MFALEILATFTLIVANTSSSILACRLACWFTGLESGTFFWLPLTISADNSYFCNFWWKLWPLVAFSTTLSVTKQFVICMISFDLWNIILTLVKYILIGNSLALVGAPYKVWISRHCSEGQPIHQDSGIHWGECRYHHFRRRVHTQLGLTNSYIQSNTY